MKKLICLFITLVSFIGQSFAQVATSDLNNFFSIEDLNQVIGETFGPEILTLMIAIVVITIFMYFAKENPNISPGTRINFWHFLPAVVIFFVNLPFNIYLFFFFVADLIVLLVFFGINIKKCWNQNRYLVFQMMNLLLAFVAIGLATQNFFVAVVLTAVSFIPIYLLYYASTWTEHV